MRRRATRRGIAAALSAGLAILSTGCSYGADPDRRIDFVVDYAGSATDLDPAGAALLARAAAAARATPSLDVVVAGYADAPLTPESNQITSRIRAQHVADRLVELGVARARITLTPRRGIGADPGRESRRVEIRLGS